jgi:hypothetical protein
MEKGDSADIGFATTCLIASVISFDEFKEWLYLVIEKSDEVPSYVFDLLDVEEKFSYTLKTRDFMGFHPSWDCTVEEEMALDGIGFKRFENFRSDASMRADAAEALEKHSYIEEKFRNFFPFIDLA